VDVQVPAGGGKVRVTEETADEVDRHSRLVEAATGFMTEISELKVLETGPLAAQSTPGARSLRWPAGGSTGAATAPPSPRK
jgi:hypothetical protein